MVACALQVMPAPAPMMEVGSFAYATVNAAGERQSNLKWTREDRSETPVKVELRGHGGFACAAEKGLTRRRQCVHDAVLLRQ
jgi:hypothetical protein